MHSDQCTSCQDQEAEYWSELFPSVGLCYPCARDFIESLYLLGVANGNPLIPEFWYGGITITIHSPYGGSAWSYEPLEGFKLVPINST